MVPTSYAGLESREPAPGHRALRVMIVDDQRDAVHSLAAILRSEGFETTGVHTAREALNALQAFDPDVVILDIAMPGMDGWNAARAIRSQQGSARPLLIAITGLYTKGADRILAQMAGFDHYLLKPCDPNVIVALIAPLVATR